MDADDVNYRYSYSITSRLEIIDAASYKLIDGYSFNIDGDAYNLNSYSHNTA